MISTHIAHCCALHGCKYGSDRCPVASLDAVQESPCELCDDWMTPEAYRETIECLIESRRGDDPWTQSGEPWNDVAECVHLLLELRARKNGRDYRMVARTVTPWQTFGPS